MMKTTKLILTILISLVIGGTETTRAQEPALSPDTNPGLLYWREFAVMPEIDSKELDRLRNSAQIDADYKNFVHQYDDMFRRLSKVRRFKGPCQWGDDLDEGPFLLLPYLAQARDIVKIESIRARFHLEEGNSNQAVDELLSAYTLAGHIADSPILINILVKFAMHKICAEVIAENLFRFSPESQGVLKAGIEAAPKGKGIADTIPTERRFMAGWLQQRLREIRTQSSGDPKNALAKARELVGLMFDTNDADQVWNDFTQAGGDSIESLIEILESSNTDYQKLEDLCRLPATQVMEQIEAFDRETKESKSPVRRWLFPSLSRSKARELGDDILMAMVRTALEVSSKGDLALRDSKNAVGGVPLKKTMFQHQGNTTGFILESTIGDAIDNRHLFLTKPIRGLTLRGPKTGQPKDSR